MHLLLYIPRPSSSGLQSFATTQNTKLSSQSKQTNYSTSEPLDNNLSTAASFSTFNMSSGPCTPQDCKLQQQLHGSDQLTQFPQPIRPFNSYSFYSDRLPHQFRGTEMSMHLPQPSRPFNADNLSSEPRVPQYQLPDQFLDSCHVFVTPTTTAMEEKEVHELVRIISALYEKLPASVRVQVSLDKLLNGETTMQRGLGVDSQGLTGPVEELSQKLERFKIRTVKLGGVVKEEEERK